jgi:hypothetical protein
MKFYDLASARLNVDLGAPDLLMQIEEMRRPVLQPFYASAVSSCGD